MFYPTTINLILWTKITTTKIVSISNIGKPFINIFNNSLWCWIFVNVADGGREYVLYSGSGYTNSDNIQFDYQKSNTNGKRARIINYVLSDSKIQKFNLWGGDNYVDDLVNGKSNTITLEYSHLKDRDNLDYNNMVIDYIDRGVGEYKIEFINSFNSLNNLIYETNSANGNGFSIKIDNENTYLTNGSQPVIQFVSI